MHKVPRLRPRPIRPISRNSEASYFQMHIYDKERERLIVERQEILKRLGMIEQRVNFIIGELDKLGNELKQKAKSPPR